MSGALQCAAMPFVGDGGTRRIGLDWLWLFADTMARVRYAVQCGAVRLSLVFTNCSAVRGCHALHSLLVTLLLVTPH